MRRRLRLNLNVPAVEEHHMTISVMGDRNVALRAEWRSCYHRSGAQDGKQVLFHRVTHNRINSRRLRPPIRRPATFLPNPILNRPE